MKMPNTIIEGKNVKVGEFLVNRLIPAELIGGIGPFLLLDHAYPVTYKESTRFTSALNEHPHRGLVAFTYVIKGEIEHVDSLGNHTFAADGGAHWLSAGKGAVHGNRAAPRMVKSGGTLQAIQFWINIPAANKDDAPQYKVLNEGDFPFSTLPDHAGVLRVILGKCGINESPVESLSGAFLYRLTLNAKSEFRFSVGEEMKCAVFVPSDAVIVNGNPIGNSQLFIPENKKDVLRFRNPGITNADAFILGGPDPNEPLVVQGPFVLNSMEQIAEAYEDFFAGKYGTFPKVQKS
jgi:redox-sensitive bicupin YhaK (pirin superfamily)